MADTYEKDLGQKSSLTTSDFIRVVGSDNVSYKQAVSSVAGTIIPTFEKTVSNNTSANDISAVGCYYGTWTNVPDSTTSGYLIVLPHASDGANYRKQIYTPYSNNVMYIRTLNGGTWTAWEKQPTRAEIDESQISITVSDVVSNPSTITAYKVGKIVTVSLWGTKFTSGGVKSNAVTGLPTAVTAASGYFALGSANAYNIQGNVYISGSSAAVSFGIRNDYTAGAAVYGSLIYFSR